MKKLLRYSLTALIFMVSGTGAGIPNIGLTQGECWKDVYGAPEGARYHQQRLMMVVTAFPPPRQRVAQPTCLFLSCRA